MRYPDWPERFTAYIESRRDARFKWGTNDCALFAADCVLALTGTDFAADLRTYDSEAGAAALIGRVGGLAAFAAGLPEKHCGLAQRGDVVLASCEGRETFGICDGNGHWMAPGPAGLVFRDLREVIKVFAV